MPFPERVQVMKQESTALGGSDADSGPDIADPINPFEDVIEAAGYEVQEPDSSTRDNVVLISRSLGKMTFKDTENTTPVTLTDLLSGAGGLSYVEFLLDNDPIRTGESAYAVTYTNNNPIKEEWRRGDATLVKSVDYTYVNSRCTQEVVKVFALNGTTILAQVTWSYTYSGGKIVSGSMTRDV
jgi:hypothetical protein